MKKKTMTHHANSMFNRHSAFAAAFTTVLGLTCLSGSALAEGWFEIKAAHSNKCIEVGGGKTEAGATINQWACTGYDNQLWKWQGKQLMNKHSGLCLDIPAASKDDKAQLMQYDCHGFPNQSFTQTADKRLKIDHSEKCVDIFGASAEDGAAVIQFTCKATGHNNQQYELIPK